MITYKHEKYLVDAINGVLIQECDFDVELIIADDCSPGRTKEVVEGFQSHRNYHWIKYTRHSSNKGMIANFIWALQQSFGSYIALCEGDDYWTDPLKLQKQVDILEKNQDFAGVFHNTIIQSKNSKNKKLIPNFEFERIYTLDDFLKRNNLACTSSIVFRNRKEIHLEFPNNIPYGDYYLHLLNLTKGNYFFIPNTMSVYRIHDGGIYSKYLNDPIGLFRIEVKNYLFWQIVYQKTDIDKNQVYINMNYHLKKLLVNAWKHKSAKYLIIGIIKILTNHKMFVLKKFKL